MKRILSCVIAVILFLCACIGGAVYHSRMIADKSKTLIYYNMDTRNFCMGAMEEIFLEGAIPVFGSSELNTSDDIAFPAALFHNGSSDFNMVLIGRGSTQSLHHAINVGAMAEDIPDKKVVLILSPQWFSASHLSSEAYASRFSERMYAQFLKNPKISDQTKQAVTDRVKSLLTSDPEQLKRVEEYERVYLEKSLNPVYFMKLSIYDSFMDYKQEVTLIKEIKDRDYQEQDYVRTADIDFEALMEEAVRAGEEACTNNDMYIYDEYYDTYVRNSLEINHNVAADSSYLVSPEYGDFCLFLDICQETGIEPLIVSVPVNGYWNDWTGFPKEERDAYYQKIRDICEEYDVELADFSDKEYEPYFLKDIMHMGWKGWVYLDEAVYEFYKED